MGRSEGTMTTVHVSFIFRIAVKQIIMSRRLRGVQTKQAVHKPVRVA